MDCTIKSERQSDSQRSGSSEVRSHCNERIIHGDGPSLSPNFREGHTVEKLRSLGVEKSRCLWPNNDWLKISVCARIYIYIYNMRQTDRQTDRDMERQRQKETERGAISWSVRGPVHVVGTSSRRHRPCNIQTYFRTKLINGTFCWCI